MARAYSFLLLSACAFPQAHFHHLSLNVTDPAAAIAFYTSHFECEPARFDGRLAAVKTQDSWLLFNKVKAPPPAAPFPVVDALGR